MGIIVLHCVIGMLLSGSLGKLFHDRGTNQVLAERIIPELESTAEPTLGHDSSTNNLIRRYWTLKEAL